MYYQFQISTDATNCPILHSLKIYILQTIFVFVISILLTIVVLKEKTDDREWFFESGCLQSTSSAPLLLFLSSPFFYPVLKLSASQSIWLTTLRILQYLVDQSSYLKVVVFYNQFLLNLQKPEQSLRLSFHNFFNISNFLLLITAIDLYCCKRYGMHRYCPMGYRLFLGTSFRLLQLLEKDSAQHSYPILFYLLLNNVESLL